MQDISLARTPEIADQKQKMLKSETRRGSKPLVEKKRRARINHSLAQLQTLVVSNKKKEGYKQNRIEKADILEMTVRYVQRVQKQEKLVKSPSVDGKFKDGYLECLAEVDRYLITIEKMDVRIPERLRAHLQGTLMGILQQTDRKSDSEVMNEEDSSYQDADSNSSPKVTSTTSSPLTSPSPSQMATTGCTNIVVTGQSISPVTLPAASTESLAGVRVIPSRLPSGQLAFVVPTQDYLQYMGQYDPSVSRASPEQVQERCTLMMVTSTGSCDTSSLSPGYLSREGEGDSPDILCRKAMCPSGGKNALESVFGNVWRPW